MPFFFGCSTIRGYEYQLEPKPTKPEYTRSVTIDSIPSGADVYAIETDGQLGAKIGTTPYVHKIGVADRNWLRSDTKERLYLEELVVWGVGTTLEWKGGGQYYERIVLLNIALALGDHSVAVASKQIFSTEEEWIDKNVSLTVPLKTLAQVNLEMEMYLRQQAINRQQNITIQQKEGSLDSVNSGLDALLKLNALRAFGK